MTTQLVSIQKAAEELGVSPQTLRRWERERRIAPAARTPGGRRRYDIEQLRRLVVSPAVPAQGSASLCLVLADGGETGDRERFLLGEWCRRMNTTPWFLAWGDLADRELFRDSFEVRAGGDRCAVGRVLVCCWTLAAPEVADEVGRMCRDSGVELVVLNALPIGAVPLRS